MRYLALQVKGIIGFQETVDRRSGTSNTPDLRKRLDASFPPEHDLHKELSGVGHSRSFAWPPDDRWAVSKRESAETHGGRPRSLSERTIF